MDRDNDILKKAFQASATFHRPLDRKHCPSLEALAQSFEPGASKRNKIIIVDHISKCSYCREEFKLYHDLQQLHLALSQNEREICINPLDVPIKFCPAIPRQLWSYASILLGLALISSVLFLFFHRTDMSEIRQTPSAAVLLVYPQSSHSISEELTFRWKELPSAQDYVLELFDDSLLPLWTSPRIQGLHVRLPSTLNQMIEVGRSYFWMITAYSGPMKTSESKLTHFVVVRD